MSQRVPVQPDDVMELPLVGREVARVAFDRYAVWLEFGGNPEGYVVRVGGPFRLVAAGSTVTLDPEEGPHPEYLRWIGRTVVRAEATEEGKLHFAFDDDLLIEVDAGPYETWHLSGPGGYEALSVAGGGLATWRAGEVPLGRAVNEASVSSSATNVEEYEGLRPHTYSELVSMAVTPQAADGVFGLSLGLVLASPADGRRLSLEFAGVQDLNIEEYHGPDFPYLQIVTTRDRGWESPRFLVDGDQGRVRFGCRDFVAIVQRGSAHGSIANE